MIDKERKSRRNTWRGGKRSLKWRRRKGMREKLQNKMRKEDVERREGRLRRKGAKKIWK